MTVISAEGIISELQQDFGKELLQQQQGSSCSAAAASSSSSKKLTLDEFLKKTDEISLFTGLAKIRINARLAGVQLSKLLAQYMFDLSDRDEQRMKELVWKVKKSAKKVRAENNNNNIAEKFVLVMDETNEMISKQKHKRKEKKKQMVKSDDDLMIQDICDAISVLGFILGNEIVPEEDMALNGARVRMEIVLGLILFNMQGLRLSIGKNDDHASWKKIKELISFLWDLESYKF